MREEKIRKFLIGTMIVASISAVLLTAFDYGFFEKSVNAQTWPGSGDWVFLLNDTDDTGPGDIDICNVYWYADTAYCYFRVETAADFDFSGGCIALTLDDPDLTGQEYELAISSHRSGDGNYAKGYYWKDETDPTFDHWATEFTENTNYIRCNDNTFSGVDFAFPKNEMAKHYFGFSTDLNGVKITVFTINWDINYFEYTGSPSYGWYWQNTPGNHVDDATDSIEIPSP